MLQKVILEAIIYLLIIYFFKKKRIIFEIVTSSVNIHCKNLVKFLNNSSYMLLYVCRIWKLS